jgi:hypothetical protein
MKQANNKPFAEIIESSLHGWLAQSWQWDQFPPFGSLVSIPQEGYTYIGIVHQVQTGSMDPMRYPFPYKKTQEELMKEQPQIFEFIKTTFNCLAIGSYYQGRISYTLPSAPPKIHSFVQPLDTDLMKQFFSNEKYLHILFANGNTIENLDELLLALLAQQKQEGALSQDKITSFMQTYSLLTGNDYRRMKLFLQRATLS